MGISKKTRWDKFPRNFRRPLHRNYGLDLKKLEGCNNVMGILYQHA